MNIALIGPSGAGKGTHAHRLIHQFNLLHACTGDLFRENLEKQTALGLLARKYMSDGDMVPDEVVDAMIEERVRKADPAQGVLFDGFPRTSYQAKFLDQVFKEVGRNLDAVFYLKVSDEEILRRITGRLICAKCQQSFHKFYSPFQHCPTHECSGEHLYQRPDDTLEMGRARLRLFHRTTGPLVDFYQDTGRLILIDAEGPITQVHRALLQAVSAVQTRSTLVAPREETALLQIPAVTPVSGAPARPRTLDLLLLGAPGSGKGTQAAVLSKQFNLPHIATGDLFRENLKNQTALGKVAKSYMERGQLVPDDITVSMVQERLARSDTQGGFLLDGFPRSVVQAEALTEMLNGLQRRITGVLYVHVSDEEIMNRLTGRLICRQCQTPFHTLFKKPVLPGVCDACGGELYQRDDDKPETIRNRLRVFHDQTEPVADYYRKAGVLMLLDGEKPVEQVTTQAVGSIQRLVAG
jgi:adenylate kinase